MRVAFITDIHGELAQLNDILDYLFVDGIKPESIVFGGDYIDKGPDSREVVKTVQEQQKLGAIVLLGNHELMLIDLVREAILNEESRKSLIGMILDQHKDSLSSYGLSAGEILEGIFSEDLLADLDWFETLPHIHEQDSLVFVHGGLEKREDWRNTDREEAVWLRPERSMDKFPAIDKTVITGHTPVQNLHPITLQEFRWRPYYIAESDCWICDGGETVVASVFESKTGQLLYSVNSLGEKVQG